MMKHFNGETTALNADTVLVINIPDATILRILSRSLFMAMLLISFPFLGTIVSEFSSTYRSLIPKFGSVDVDLILHDLADEGLLKKHDKALLLAPPSPSGFGFGNIASLHKNDIELFMDSDLETNKSLFPDESYDFVFFSGIQDAEFVDRIVKIHGIVAFPLGTKPSNAAFREQSNYRLVYLRRFGSIVVALNKTGSSLKRKLFQLPTEAKTVAFNGLEPPRQAFANSNKYLKNIKFLPDLLDDSLQGYDRRLFVSVGLPEENKDVIQWFQQNYPKKNTQFEIHSLHRAVPQTDVSAWLSKRVKEEEYVVMKAEAEEVEEMIKKRTIGLVDELFLECKNEWWQGGKRTKSGRAYWECLALYAKLRDEGIAVHQWWG